MFRTESILFVLSLLLSVNGLSQNESSQTKTRKTQVEKAFDNFDLASSSSDPEKAMTYTKKACDYCKRSGLDSMIMRCYYERGYVHYMQGSFELASKDFQRSINLCEKIGDKSYEFRNYSALGSVKSTQGYPNIGLKYLIKALELAEEVDDSLNIGVLNANIGNAYVNLADIPENRKTAEVFLRKAIRILKKIDASPGPLIHAYITLSKVVTDKSQKIAFIDYALASSKQADIAYLIGYCYSVKGDHMFEFKEYQDAISWYLKALENALETGDENAVEVVMISLMDAQVKKGDFNAAIRIQKDLDTRFFYNDLLLGNKMRYLEVVSLIYADQGEFSLAYEYAKLHSHLVDSVSQAELNERFIKYNKEFELEEKDKEIAQQKLEAVEDRARQDRIITGVLTGSALILLLLVILYYRRKRAKQATLDELRRERELNEFRTTFLENIAHEIRTPITLINGYLTLAMDGLEDEKVSRQINSAMQSSKKVLANTNEILELLKLEKGKLPIVISTIVIDGFVQRVFYSFESLAGIKGVKLKMTSNIKGHTSIESDENRIEKILNNFFSNAVKFSPSESTIECEINVENSVLKISVHDKGPGVSEGEQEKIFDRFYQSSENPSIGGVGVGLSLARDFAESLNGKVYVSSKRGNGSTFVFELPVSVKHDPIRVEKKVYSNQEIESHKAEFTESGRPRILIIEDNPEMNAYLNEILANNYSCDCAFNGIEGLQKAQKRKYSLIISDVMMPEMDGFELRKKINTLENYRNTPYIFITAKAQLSDKIEGYNLGVDDYITKPFDREELLVRIQNLLKTKQEREHWVKDNLDFVGEDDGTAEDQLLVKMKSIVNDNISNEEFKITELAAEMGYSPRQLSRITQKMIGMSSVQFVLEVRLQKAYLCLSDKKFSTLSEVRHYVGIPTASHFNKKFFDRYGKKPSEV